MIPKKAKGSIGSWFATVDGESLPCVHKHWWVKTARYNDHLLRSSPQADEFVAAIREKKRVILKISKPNSEANPVPFKHVEYVAVWEVDNIDFDENGLRFQFIKSLVPLK